MSPEYVAVRRGRRYRQAPVDLRLPVAVSVVGLALIMVGLLTLVRPSIERDLERRTAAALQQAGFTRVAVRVEGRDVTLDGPLLSPQDRARAISVAQAVEGVRAIREVYVRR